MRIPVYSPHANPQVDPPTIRKKLAYANSLIADHLARWVTPGDCRQGIQLFVPPATLRPEEDRHEFNLNKVAGSGFGTAWHLKQSGYAGPLVWQLKTANK